MWPFKRAAKLPPQAPELPFPDGDLRNMLVSAVDGNWLLEMHHDSTSVSRWTVVTVEGLAAPYDDIGSLTEDEAFFGRMAKLPTI